jgi:hypothetical protein
MVDQVQGAMSSLEQYRMAMNIIKTWDAYRMPVIYAFGALLILTIVLFIMKSCWKKWVLFFTILAGLTIVAFDGFKMYVDYKKHEAIKTNIIAPITEAAEQIAEKATGQMAEVAEQAAAKASSKVTEGLKGLLK